MFAGSENGSAAVESLGLTQVKGISGRHTYNAGIEWSMVMTILGAQPVGGAAESSPSWLLVAPHRLMFFIGASNLMLAMLCWAVWLVAQRWPGLGLPIANMATHVPPGWLHAFIMQYQVLPSFMFGFLLTVFPRWMGLPELARWRYLPVGIGLVGGQALCLLASAFGWRYCLEAGLILTAIGWLVGLWTLGSLLFQEKGCTWHARSCFLAFIFGFFGLCAFLMFSFGGAPMWAFVSIKMGSFGLLMPIYFTVAHRMFPFFAGNVCKGYTPWRPMWLLAAFWPLSLAHLALELVHGYAWLWPVDLALLGLTAVMLLRWWPRGPKPALLSVLFIAFAWLPITFALYVTQSLIFWINGAFTLGRAPAHALFIGFFGSALIAMVTRVTQGHSGRALVMPPVAIFAFICIQIVAILRIIAELTADALFWQAVSAVAWLLALGPWVLWLNRIYLAPRVDGKPG